MKTPYPFEPLWECLAAGILHRGKGTLASSLWKIKELIDEFSVVLPNGKITAFPKRGVIMSNGINRIADIGGPAELLWYRRMEMQIATHDTNKEMSPQCLWYGLGLKNDRQVEFRVMPDLRLINANTPNNQ